MKRRLNDWISHYLKYTDNSESPISYHMWSGLSCISSALQRKTYFTWGHTTIYPNLYIIIIGPSGHGRKGEPLSIAKVMMEKVGIDLLGDDVTPERMIQKLSGVTEPYNYKGRYIFQSPMTVCAAELSVFLGKQNSAFQAVLTKMYDSEDKYIRETKNKGDDEILGVCVNLLAATAPDWLPHILTHEAIGGGFTSRCIFVVEDGKRQTIADPNANMPPDQLRKDLIHDLGIIKQLKGGYRFDEQAFECYKEWYVGEDEVFKTGEHKLREPALVGYLSRRQTHVKKLAMILTASHTDEPIIKLKDFKRALHLMEATEVNMPKAFRGFGKARYAEETEKVLQYIQFHKTVLRKDLMRDFYRDIDDSSLESIITVLHQMKIIEVHVMNNERRYTYIDGDSNG